MKAVVISVAKNFSAYPAGRFRDDGPASGEEFRDRLLIPALKRGPVTVDLDGTRGYGSSFLDEAFGGLIRNGSFTKEELRDRLRIASRDKSLVMEVWSYIDPEQGLALQ